MLGLFAFFYGSLHFLTYLVLDQFFDVDAIVADIVKRPFITVGFTAFVLMIPLALTSTAGWIRRLGGKRWHLLHRLVYVSAIGRRRALLVAGEERHLAPGPVRRHRRRSPRGAGLVRLQCAAWGSLACCLCLLAVSADARATVERR